MSALYRLVYASKNLLHGSDSDIASAVLQILEASQRNNVKVDVTGALLFNKGAFAQVLEGPRRNVEDTIERIQQDPRHGDVTVLQCGPVDDRGFPTWSMAFVGHSREGQAMWSDLAERSGFDMSRLDGDAVFTMLHGLVLEEEGVPRFTSPVPSDKAVDAPSSLPLDVEQVRAELGDLLAGAVPSKAEPEIAAAAPMPETREAGDACALTVLKGALASERRRTTELREELDDVRIALAEAQARIAAGLGERDIWAKRARLLAQAIGQEAEALGMTASPPTTGKGRSLALLKRA